MNAHIRKFLTALVGGVVVGDGVNDFAGGNGTLHGGEEFVNS